ncbi:hypothetical protein D1007_27751 [Hordeum vulgare]|nr:hypothetical protein D1007_27751 [Hordeum vulgare]
MQRRVAAEAAMQRLSMAPELRCSDHRHCRSYDAAVVHTARRCDAVVTAPSELLRCCKAASPNAPTKSNHEKTPDTHDTIPEPLWCGAPMEEVAKCTLHETRPRKGVAFEVKWVDPVHPDILKNRLIKPWELFHEQNLGGIQDKNAYDAELDKLMKEKDHLLDYQKAMDDEKFEKQKEELEMEKLRLAKEQRCILQAQEHIIHKTRKAMKEIKVYKDLLAQEKKELEKVVADLLNAGHGSKEKLEKIKAILES